MEMNSPPPPCPNTVTVRRNPHRKARPTPSAIPLPTPLSSPLSSIPSFPINDILSEQLTQNPKPDLSTSDSTQSENLKVFLRIRPLTPHNQIGVRAQTFNSKPKNAWPQNPNTKSKNKNKKKSSEICISVNDSHSITLSPPTTLQDVKRNKSELYQGFSHVFPSDSSQNVVFETMVSPLVDEFLRGKSGMLAALGPSGSGKTHTVFGTPREPGMVPRALRRMFSRTEGETLVSRTFYLSMLEICSEKGKAERILDLSQDVGDVCIQQSTIKGLKEVIIHDAQQAESLIACGLLKRATAMTNSNSQSSRSQCIINIRITSNNNIDDEVDLQSNSAVLTIVDLAGAEREKRTGNQGARLLESNFINNTSMVFGLCLRSLLEHQKNPRKPLQKHCQSSLLTRYLRDYLEGKKRMALILTVKPGEEDYHDTSFLLRQASPCMEIKFNNVEERCAKRQFQSFSRTEQLKRVKLTREGCLNNRGKGAGDEFQLHKEDSLPQEVKEVEPQNCSVNDVTTLEEGSTELEKERKNKIMQNFAKALWNVLKQYKEKLEVAENEIQCLRESLANEKAQCSEFETELKDLKSHFLCQKEVSSIKGDESSANGSAKQEGCQPTDVHELNAGVSSLNLDESEHTAGEQRSDTNVNSLGLVIASSLVENVLEQGYQYTVQERESFMGNGDSEEDLKDLKDLGIDDIQFNADVSDSGPSESVVSSPKSLVIITNDSCCSVEGWYQSHSEKDKTMLDQPKMPAEDVEFGPETDVSSAPKSEPNSCCNPLNAEKPKRRLLPASSILLKNISSLDFEENEKPKVTRGEKNLASEERNRTQGSISLLRLLRSNLHL